MKIFININIIIILLHNYTLDTLDTLDYYKLGGGGTAP